MNAHRVLRALGFARVRTGQVVVDERAVMLLASRVEIFRRCQHPDNLAGVVRESQALVDSVERLNP